MPAGGCITNAERNRRARLLEAGLKVCSACRRELPVGDFGPRSDTPDGLKGKCRACLNEGRPAAKSKSAFPFVNEIRWR